MESSVPSMVKETRVLLRFQQLFVDRCDLVSVVTGTGVVPRWFEIHSAPVERGNVDINVMGVGDFFDIVEKFLAVFDLVGFLDVLYDSIGLIFFMTS